MIQLGPDACALHSSVLVRTVLLPGLEVAGTTCPLGGGKRSELYPVALQCCVLDSLTCSQFGAEPVGRISQSELVLAVQPRDG